MGKKEKRSLKAEEEVAVETNNSSPPSKKAKQSLGGDGTPSSAKKDKKAKKEVIIEEENDLETSVAVTPGKYSPADMTYSQKLTFASTIAHPMASKKLTKKLLKLMKKVVKETGPVGSKTSHLVVGLKSVQTAVNKKNETGLMIFAGNVTPIEIMCHLPAVCEDKAIPYVYVPMKDDISTAIGIRRACIMVLVKRHDSYEESYIGCLNEVKSLSIP